MIMTAAEMSAYMGIQSAIDIVHKTATDAGWYSDPATGQPIERNFAFEVGLAAAELLMIKRADPKDEPELSYAAGLFDGEGHIGINKLKSKIESRADRYMSRCQVASTDRELLVPLEKITGKVVACDPGKWNENARPAWKWEVHSQHAAKFLSIVGPFLRASRKRECAKLILALEFSRLPKGGHCRWDKTPSIHISREWAYQRLKALNSGSGRDELMDDKLPHRPGQEVEFADCVIRIFDTCAARGYDLAGAIIEKNRFNRERADHKLENRSKAGGKRY